VIVAAAIGPARALQTHSIGRKLRALLWLSFWGGGRFGGFVRLELGSAVDWIHHMSTEIGEGAKDFRKFWLGLDDLW
jgi:hypothetical protein